MKETNKQENQDAVQVPEKKEYQAPTCEQHKPLDHVRTWQTKSLPS
jgi:hypothetical protein